MKLKYIQICPQCKSPDIETDFSNAASVALGFLRVKKCNNCGHEGTFFPSIPLKKLKKPLPAKKAKNKKYFDTSFAKGNFYLRFTTLGVTLILAGLFMILVNLKMVGLLFLVVGLSLIAYLTNKMRRLGFEPR